MTPRENIIPVFVPHLGCPYHCVFCNQNHISGADRPATPDDVRAAVEAARNMKHSGARNQLAFYGGSFTAIPAQEQEALLSAAQAYVQSGELDSIRLSTRPDAIDRVVIDRLKHYGVKTVELGAQSMDEEVLRRSARGHTAQDVVNASRMLKDAGFRLILQMMTGLPGDTPEKALQTAESIAALQPDGVRIYPTVIVRDTALYVQWKNGTYPEHTVEDAVDVCAKLLPVFQNAEIPVIRLGLNPTDELSGGSAVGGAYHPALGELVKGRIFRNRMELLLSTSAVKQETKVTLGVNSRQLSQWKGQHRCNELWLAERFCLKELSIKPADVEAGVVQIMETD